ncbi:arsenite efflux membrane protein ArsB [Pseudonocardia sediminis]|uniref:Arsenite efflux membrane protein ArsB n=1 Tax=Pseudonocardia sediminis TaxID=1397368 RepID=A0A4Q7UUA7_PSEST|nr:SLC13 family permease [Pseudonocardia sediminis]RZT85325.1 arsenite efflux membrane protein ArsB [Pseudonocardia sediminis]
MIPLLAAVGLLVVVLLAATLRPFGLAEAVTAVPAAAIAVVTGLISPAAAWREIVELGPTVGFLAAILLLGHLADVEGVFSWLGGRLAGASRGSSQRLLGLVFVTAAGTTAVLSLDATVVLLTPVVLLTAARLRLPARPHSYACAHLSNSASGLLPVSNLTNLLAFSASGLTFLGFAGLMVAPWLVVIAVEYVVMRRFFATDLASPLVRPGPGAVATTGSDPVVSGNHCQGDDIRARPDFALAVLALTLVGFGASSAIGVEPAWVAAGGAVVLAVRVMVRREIGPVGIVRALSLPFCLFVLALGVVVAAVSSRGLADGLAALLPSTPSLLGLLAVAGIAAVLANLVNNLPATLVLLTAVGATAHPAIVLAVLLGVNIGPNLTYTGSLATLLWRRVAGDRGEPPRLGTFLALGALTVPLGLAAATVALWAVVTLTGVS